jgi:hypothetical protein
MEAYNLFKTMLAGMNKDIVSFLFKATECRHRGGKLIRVSTKINVAERLFSQQDLDTVYGLIL